MHKRLLQITLIVSLLLVGGSLTGCNSAKNSTANNSAAQQQVQNDLQLTTSQQVKSINPQTPQGQKQVDDQIDKNLNALDNSLNELDKSLGNL